MELAEYQELDKMVQQYMARYPDAENPMNIGHVCFAEVKQILDEAAGRRIEFEPDGTVDGYRIRFVPSQPGRANG